MGKSSFKNTGEQKYIREIMDQLPDGVILHALDGRIIACNATACRLYCYTREEMLKLRIADLAPERIAATLPRLITVGGTTQGVYVWMTTRKKNGQVFTTEVSSNLIRIGGEDRILVCMRDINLVSQEQTALAGLNDSGAEHIPVYLITWQFHDNDFVLIGYSNSAERFTRDLISYEIGKTAFKREMTYRTITTREDKSISLTYVYVPPNLVVNHIEDMTDRHKAQAALQEGRERLRAQYDHMPVPTLTWQGRGQKFFLIDHNRVMKEFTKGAIVDHLGKTADMLYSDRLDIQADIRNCFQRKKEVKRETFYITFSGLGKKLVVITNTFVPPDLVLSHIEDITARKMFEEELRNSEQNLRSLSSQLFQAEEKERQRIARDIHDSIGQHLSAIKINADRALTQVPAGSPAEAIMEAGIPLIQQTIEEVRRIIMDLRPTVLDLGILATISWFCREFNKIYPDIKVEQELAVEEQVISSSLKIILFRILQEAMNNSARHSRAYCIKVSLRHINTMLELIVEDNGIGFDVDKTRRRTDCKGVWELPVCANGWNLRRDNFYCSPGTVSEPSFRLHGRSATSGKIILQ